MIIDESMTEREEERTTMTAARAAVIALACLALLVACSLALFGWARVAQGEGDVSFGIRPSEANPEKPETFSFFSHEMTAGETLEDAAVVQNHGDVTATARVYLADGVTSINGGTAFTHEGFQTHGTANWLTLESQEITLAPGEEGIVSFTISVPAGTSPGEYVAGLVVQGEADAQAGTAGFTVNVVKRSAVAVLVDVPGARLAKLEITGVGLSQQNENGSVFIVDVRNTGNILLKGTGLVIIEDGKGTELATVPFEMGTVLAHDNSSFYVSHPIHLEDGSYQLSATLDYVASRGGEVGDAPAVIEGVGLVVENGQPQDPTKVADPELPPRDVVSIGGSDETESSVNTVMIVGIIAAIVLAAAATGTFVLRRRRQPLAD